MAQGDRGVAAAGVHGPLLVVHQLRPHGHAERLAGHGQVVEDVVLGLDPRHPQADRGHARLAEVLLEHGLFDHLRQRVVARIGDQRHVFADRHRLRVEVDPVDRVAAGQDDSPRRLRAHGRIQQVERALDADLDQGLAVFLAGGQMDHGVAAGDQVLDRPASATSPWTSSTPATPDGVPMAQRDDLIAGVHQGLAERGAQFAAGPGHHHASDRRLTC